MSVSFSFLLSTILMFMPLSSPPDEDPEGRQGTFALTNAEVVTVTQGTIENGTVVIEGDRIVSVGTDVDIPGNAEVIDLEGQSIYPGFIDSGTHLGLAEISSVSLTIDVDEVGTLTPQMQAISAINPNSAMIPVTRIGGVTTAITEPTGSLLPGRAALINLQGYTAAHMHMAGFEAAVLEFPSTGRAGPWDQRPQEEIDREAEEALDELHEVWDRAEAFDEIRTAYEEDPDQERTPEYSPELEGMRAVVTGEIPVMIHADADRDIVAALEFIEERELENVMLSGLNEGWRVADRIAEAGVPALVGSVHSLPSRESDRYDKPYANAGLMHDAGVQVALRTGETENVRNLPFHAGFAAAYGMGRDDALEAITIVPARIFGVDDEIGSIEEGKRANVFVSDGDPFEPRSEITHLFIDGYKLPIDSQQERLYREFRDRHPGTEK